MTKVVGNSDSLNERTSKLVQPSSPTKNPQSASPHNAQVLVYDATTGRGLAHVHYSSAHFLKPCWHRLKKNTPAVGALVINDFESSEDNAKKDLLWKACLDGLKDRTDFIHSHFLNSQDPFLADCSNYPTNGPLNEDAQNYNVQANFHDCDPKGTYCIGRVFLLKTLEEAWKAKDDPNYTSDNPDYTKEFLANYLKCFQNAVEHPFVPALDLKQAKTHFAAEKAPRLEKLDSEQGKKMMESETYAHARALLQLLESDNNNPRLYKEKRNFGIELRRQIAQFEEGYKKNPTTCDTLATNLAQGVKKTFDQHIVKLKHDQKFPTLCKLINKMCTTLGLKEPYALSNVYKLARHMQPKNAPEEPRPSPTPSK
jgi:hypothetical protein